MYYFYAHSLDHHYLHNTPRSYTYVFDYEVVKLELSRRIKLGTVIPYSFFATSIDLSRFMCMDVIW